MRRLLAILAAFSLFAFSGVVSAQSASVLPNNVNRGGTVTVTLDLNGTGLGPGTVINVKFAGIGANGVGVNGAHNVTVGSDGTASWQETINWAKDDTYATNVSWRVGDGMVNDTTAGNLIVH